MTHRIVGFVVALGLIGAPAVLAAQGHVPLSDQQIQGQVEHKLSHKNIVNVTVSVTNGVVTLMGTVPSAWAKQTAVEEAFNADDVMAVTNQLTVARGESDLAIAEAIAKSVRRYVFYTIFDDVNVAVNNGVVTLTGRVTMPYKAAELVDLASRVHGVQSVKNDILTYPTSIADDQLRASIASRIYRDPLFWNYAIQVNPPIHIVVENLRVTLTGAVGSEVERRKAEILARSTFGVLSVDNKLRIER